MSNLVFMVGVAILVKSINSSFPIEGVMATLVVGVVGDILSLLFRGVK
jgi:hypothetical protein